jgi:hypothetical protein
MLDFLFCGFLKTTKDYFFFHVLHRKKIFLVLWKSIQWSFIRPQFLWFFETNERFLLSIINTLIWFLLFCENLSQRRFFHALDLNFCCFVKININIVFQYVRLHLIWFCEDNKRLFFSMYYLEKRFSWFCENQ